jgi:hypothetical protein
MMEERRMLSRASKIPFALQAALVFVLVGSSTYAAGYFDFRNGSNLVWMFGIPIATAIIANNDAGSRTLAGIA